MENVGRSMKVGDLIEVCPPPDLGALTAVKFFNRLLTKTGGLPGVVIVDHGKWVTALFGEEVVDVSKRHAKVLDNRANASQNEV